jgi:DNA repair protein RadC
MYKAMKTKISMMTVCEADGPAIKSGRDFAELCLDLEDMSQESFHVITLNQKNVVIDRHMVSLGSLTAALVHPREVFRPAVLQSAAAVCVVHNHPSGDPTPSAHDRAMTERLVQASEIMGIRLLDHVVIGKGRFFSFVDEGLM